VRALVDDHKTNGAAETRERRYGDTLATRCDPLSGPASRIVAAVYLRKSTGSSVTRYVISRSEDLNAAKTPFRNFDEGVDHSKDVRLGRMGDRRLSRSGFVSQQQLRGFRPRPLKAHAERLHGWQRLQCHL
jgi:hypothetical protein